MYNWLYRLPQGQEWPRLAKVSITLLSNKSSCKFNKLIITCFAYEPISVLSFAAQSCPTLCNPIDYGLPDSSAHGDSQGKNARVGLPHLSPGDRPKPEIEPRSRMLLADSL